MNPFAEALSSLATVLDRLGIPYLVGGSLASGVRGMLRVAGMQRRSRELHALRLGIVTGNIPGDNHRNLLNLLKLVIGNVDVHIRGEVGAYRAGHPIGFPQLIYERVLGLLVDAVLCDEEAHTRGDEQRDRDRPRDFRRKFQVVEHLFSPFFGDAVKSTIRACFGLPMPRRAPPCSALDSRPRRFRRR